MNGYDRKVMALAICLACLAGFVDALGFLNLGGLFVSFMSGNTTRLAAGLAEGAYDIVLLAAGLIILFLLGVVLGALFGRAAGKLSSKAHVCAVLTFVAVLLLLGALAQMSGLIVLSISCIVMAMGAENAAFERDGEVAISLTYVTGTLVKMGQHTARALAGGPKWGWVPYAFLWIGLMSGAILGAYMHKFMGMDALWIAAVFAGILALLSYGSNLFTPKKAHDPLAGSPE